jgi:hypothetical protein
MRSSGILVQRILDSRPWEKYSQLLVALGQVSVSDAARTIIDSLGPTPSPLGTYLYDCVQSLVNIHFVPPDLPVDDYDIDIYMDLARLRRLLSLYQSTRKTLDAYKYTNAVDHIVLTEQVAACKTQCEQASPLFARYVPFLHLSHWTVWNWLESHDLCSGTSVAQTILLHHDESDVIMNTRWWVSFDSQTMININAALSHYTEVHAGIVRELHESMIDFRFIEPVLVELDPGLEPYVLYIRSAERHRTSVIVEFAKRLVLPLCGTVADVRRSLQNPAAKYQVRYLRGRPGVQNVLDDYESACQKKHE